MVSGLYCLHKCVLHRHYSTAQYSTVLYCSVQHCTVLDWTGLGKHDTVGSLLLLFGLQQELFGGKVHGPERDPEPQEDDKGVGRALGDRDGALGDLVGDGIEHVLLLAHELRLLTGTPAPRPLLAPLARRSALLWGLRVLLCVLHPSMMKAKGWREGCEGSVGGETCEGSVEAERRM